MVDWKVKHLWICRNEPKVFVLGVLDEFVMMILLDLAQRLPRLAIGWDKLTRILQRSNV